MLVKIKQTDADTPLIAYSIYSKIVQAGYRADVQPLHKAVKISDVRRQVRGDYCGNHPGSCQFRPHFAGQRHHGTWLEGGDWLVVDDLINDVLDQTNTKADVGVGNINVRIGGFRRVIYTAFEFNPGVYEWNPFGQPTDYGWFLGKTAPRARAMAGTPGMSIDRALPHGFGVTTRQMKIGTLRRDLKEIAIENGYEQPKSRRTVRKKAIVHRQEAHTVCVADSATQ